MTTKLALYKDVLLILGQERIASLSEASSARYALDDAYDKALSYCLEQGFWNHAMRAVQIDASTTTTPTFGYSQAFNKPDDFIRTLVLADNENFNPPLLTYSDEPNYWYANCDPLYAKYVSDSAYCGADLGIWPETFANYMATRLAVKTCKRITGSYPDADMLKQEKRARADALSKDAMNEPPGFPPRGTWVTSRTVGNSNTRWDRQSS